MSNTSTMTMGCDLGDKYSDFCVLDRQGKVVENGRVPTTRSELEKLAFYFTEANVEFNGVVRPGERIMVRSRKVFFRRRKLRCEVEAAREDGEVVCSGTLAGMGVPR